MVEQRLIEEFRRDGAILLKGVADEGWLARLREALEQNIASPGPTGKVYTKEGESGFYFGDYCNWDRFDGYRDFVRDSGIAGKVAALLGSEKVNLFHEHVLVKDPGTENPTPWHHDQPYWVVDGDQVCSTWVALDPVPADVAMEFVAGSHKPGTHYRPRYFIDHRDYEDHDGPSVPDVDADRGSYRILNWALEPGDCVVFHARTLHAAPGNRGKHRRRAVAYRWTGDDARFARRKGQMSPPFPDVPHKPGDIMDSPIFPVVWPPERSMIR
ncbi:MAG: phytanoyl-CoA dioxygenase family protein [Minwuia sp.]|uniref:phytanoyl-CoA dioxygenase family protein n=1 Tax=Minwuia sp. TaxID=2493630 RepID=UPI003A872409